MATVETVTILFTDLVGSTQLQSEVGPARADALNQRRKSLFGATEPQLIATERVRSEHNCAPIDIVEINGHLLYARALEAMGDTAAALHEYEALASGFPGEEGRARYAQLLLRDGQKDKAQAVFRDIVKRSDLAPGYYRRDQREWIDLAKREMRA